MTRNILLILVSLFITMPVIAKEVSYQGKINGMSCAFCVYNVSKKIRSLPGVKADSVKVNLKTGLINFRSTSDVKIIVISGLVKSAGFTLSDFKSVKSYKAVTYKKAALVSVKLNSIDLKAYNDLLEKLGDIAANELGKLVITAPESVETQLLKIMIAGRQKVAKVKFIKTKDKAVEIRIYQTH